MTLSQHIASFGFPAAAAAFRGYPLSDHHARAWVLFERSGGDVFTSALTPNVTFVAPRVLVKKPVLP